MDCSMRFSKEGSNIGKPSDSGGKRVGDSKKGGNRTAVSSF